MMCAHVNVRLCACVCVCADQAGPAILDLNAPVPGGLTALMLSVRDVDLMEDLMETPLSPAGVPRPGEVVRELLLLLPSV